ncbi:MAG: cpxA, partial [Gammaproteobacteria bacterium]|nr:cpxA [Gammaproteobacteria bacterium]
LLSLYLLQDNGRVIAHHRFPQPPLDEELHRLLTPTKEGGMVTRAFGKAPFIVSEPFVAADGHRYRVAAKLPRHTLWSFNGNAPLFLFRFFVTIVGSGIICYFLSLYLLKPFRALQQFSKKLGEGKLDTRLDKALTSRRDEIGELASEFDHMADQLQYLLETQQRLLQDVSHELRSPLARLYVALEIAKNNANKNSIPALERIELEANRLNNLIASVLSFASLNITPDSLSHEIIELYGAVEEIVKDAQFEGEAQGKKIILSELTAVYIDVNAILLRSAVENIIRNALRYSPSDKAVEVSVYKKADKAYVSIRDYGSGVPEEKIALLAEPFYRVDSDRNMQSGGYGLGLAITHKVAALYHGTVHIENAKPAGLCVTIELPLASHL